MAVLCIAKILGVFLEHDGDQSKTRQAKCSSDYSLGNIVFFCFMKFYRSEWLFIGEWYAAAAAGDDNDDDHHHHYHHRLLFRRRQQHTGICICAHALWIQASVFETINWGTLDACCTRSMLEIYYRLVEPSRGRVTLAAPDTRISSIPSSTRLADCMAHRDKIDLFRLTTTSHGNRALVLCFCLYLVVAICHPPSGRQRCRPNRATSR